jgi:subtilisin family serine protease
LHGYTTSKDWENEPYYKYSWHINPSKTALTTLGYIIDNNADIHLNNIWDITQGEGVKVAIIDENFDTEHEDLKPNIIDKYNVDDNNTDVSNNTSYPSHGNSCAGLIVAPINGKGVIGIAPKASIILIKQTSNSDVDTIKAFEYAKNRGAKVVSCSWGTENVSQAVADEIKSLYDANITVVFASGNDSKDLDEVGINDESELSWVIGVGSSDELNNVAYYSNYGSNIDILAPGGDRNYLGILGLDDSGDKGSMNQQNLVSNNYTFVEGTSFAAPIVAGVVALMYSVNPNLTPSQIRDILITTALKIDSSASYNNDGFDTKRAYGKINAYKSVIEARQR